MGIALFVKADNAEDLLRKQKEEKRQRERHEAAERIEQQRRDRFRTLEARYGDDVLFASREHDEVLTQYARDHKYELLASARTKTIVEDYEKFHTQDLDFSEWLRATHPQLYVRIDEIFFYRARALADTLPQKQINRMVQN